MRRRGCGRRAGGSRARRGRTAARARSCARRRCASCGVWAGTLHQRLGSASAIADVLDDPSAQTVALRGSSGTLVVGHTRRGVLVMNGLAASQAGKTYEVWVIQGGKPRPAGVFRRGGVVLLSEEVPPNATVAVTVEPAGGSSQPTSAPFASAST